MPNYAELSPEAEALLSEIIEHEEAPNYWEKRFEGLTRKEDSILRGCFKELKENGMISTLWASNVPYEIEVLKDGYMYDQHRNENEIKMMSSFELELNDLISREKKIRVVKNQYYSDEEIKELSLQRQVWINDVFIFYSKYLKRHTLGPFIYNVLYDEGGQDQDITINDLLSSLISISKDKTFIDSMREAEKNPAKLQIQTEAEYDVFISHANSDKPVIVDEINSSLEKLGISIFYDKKSLEWGDHWKKRILDGTQKAEFAIIVISENFFDREWTERELDEFLNRQNSNGQKLILPILHNITIAQLQEKYPSVADIQGISTKDYTCDQIALLFARQLIQRLRLAHIQ